MASKQQADQELDPKYEWQENAANFLLRVHLSGFRKEDFRVQVDGAGRLTVRGQRADGGKHVRFHKVFQLPPTSNLDDISGRFEAGVLNITVPKRPEQPPATIQDIIRKPTTKPKEDKVDEEAKKAKKLAEEKKAEQDQQKPDQEDASATSRKKAADDKQINKQDMEAKKKKAADERTKEEVDKPDEEHKTTMTPKVQEPTTETKPPQQAADRDSLLERVRRRAEEERAKAAAAAEEAEHHKKQKNWKEELQGITASEWAESALDTVKKNKEVIAAAVAAFSIGLFVSSRLFSRK